MPPKRELYRWKIHDSYESGVADSWYSGDKADLWVEYKYVQALPVRANVKLDLSALQKDWLRSRHKEGRNVAVIVGSPDGGVIFHGNAWEQYENDGIPLTTFRATALSKPVIAEWIRAQVSFNSSEGE